MSEQSKAPPEPAAKPSAARLARTPEQQAAVDRFHATIGQALLDNPNRNTAKNGHS